MANYTGQAKLDAAILAPTGGMWQKERLTSEYGGNREASIAQNALSMTAFDEPGGSSLSNVVTASPSIWLDITGLPSTTSIK